MSAVPDVDQRDDDSMLGFMREMISHQQERDRNQDERDEKFKETVLTILGGLESNVISAVNAASDRVTGRIAIAAFLLVVLSQALDYAMMSDRDFGAMVETTATGVSASVDVVKPTDAKD